MQAVLKVVGGKNDGREIKITVPEFVIGRGDQAHLRPASDLISRKHCAIRLKEGRVEIEDLGSRNGSFVNDVQLAGVHQAKSGDRLRVGRLNFEILIDPTEAGNKKPKVKDVVEAITRTAEQPNRKKDADEFEDSISDWLLEGDEEPMSGSFGNNATVQFSMDDVEAILSAGSQRDSETEPKEDSAADDSDDSSTELDSKKKRKKEYGKLPPMPKQSHEDSTKAAGDVLKKFFNRR